jgi:hypothetical protein
MDTGSHNLQPNHSLTSLTTTETSNTTQMHPLAIPSSANCPPHVVTATNQTLHAQLQSSAGMQNALFPVALSALGGHSAAAFAAAGLSMPLASNHQQQQQPQTQQQQTQQMNSNTLFYPTQSLALQANLQQSNCNTNNNQGQQQQQQQQPQVSHTQQSQDNTNNHGKSTGDTSPPPFYLFDAPVELRVNFMQSQRMHGLPITEDSNSYHYGVAVNGFHPQMNAQLNPANASGGASSSSGGSQNHHSSSVQLVDARHGSRKAGRIKNEREQRRAQKITELIDQLREKMENGGWKVEVKSKFHTLSS